MIIIEEFINKVPENINLQEVQKTALLGTMHILHKVLSIK